jgi:hypothetical protein
MENQKTQRLLYDTECKDCEHKAICEHVDTLQCCRAITDQLRVELRNNRKRRRIVAKIGITTEYIYDNCSRKLIKKVANKGTFVLQEPYIFSEPFLRAEIDGECNGGTFSTEYYGWKI